MDLPRQAIESDDCAPGPSNLRLHRRAKHTKGPSQDFSLGGCFRESRTNL